MSIGSLDLLGQNMLAGLTRRLFVRFLAEAEVGREDVPTQVRRYFPDFQPGEAAIDLAEIGPERIDVRRATISWR